MEEGTSHLEDQVMTTLVSTVILGRRLENSVVEEIVKISFGRTKKIFDRTGIRTQDLERTR